MSEPQPIKPEAKHKVQHKIPLRPTTEGHNLTDTINPELERNQPEFTEDKLKLNVNAKPFVSQRLENKLYNKGMPNNPEFQNNYRNNYYNPNAMNNMNNMNMNAFPPGHPYGYQMQMQYNPGYSPHFNNNIPMNPRGMPMYAPQPPQNYPPYDYPMNQGNRMIQNNFGYNYPRPNTYHKAKDNYNNPKLIDTPQRTPSQTGLDIHSKPFNPKKNKEEKNEKEKEDKNDKKKDNNDISLNIHADPYQPRNIQLKQKEDLAHSNKEDKVPTPEVKKKDNPLAKLLSDNTSKNTTEKAPKITHNKEYVKTNSNTLKKKNSKKTELDKKFENITKATERSRKEEEQRKLKEKEEKKRREEEERKKREEERRIKEEEEKKRLEEERRRKEEEESKIIERKYFITFKNKKSERHEKFTFEYIMQFKKWKISTEDELLTKEVKDHFANFKEEIKEGGKSKKNRDDNNKKKDNYIKTKVKESSEKKLPAVSSSSMEQWARIDLTKEIKAAEEFKQKLNEENKQDILKKDLRNLLNLLTHDNYPKIKQEIIEKIGGSIEDQDKFLDVLFQKAVLEKAYVKLYCMLVKELDNYLVKNPPKPSEKDKDKDNDKDKENKKEVKKGKKEHSEMRSHLIDRCKIIFQLENNEQFDQYIKEKDPEERRNKLKKFILGNVYFITELMKIKILSKKVGPDCLKHLYDRYQKNQTDKTLKEITLEAIIIFSENFGRIIYEEKKMKTADKQQFNKVLDDIFQKLENIMNEPGLVGHIKYNIYNLLEKRKNNFALSKFDESLIAKTKEEVEKESENETQENINEMIKKELKIYKECIENGDENEDPWKITSALLKKRISYGKTFGDILEGFFMAASEIYEEERNHDYVKKYIDELIEFYYKRFTKKDIKELKERILKLFEIIVDISLDVPDIFDIYAYVLNIFLQIDLIQFSDLVELKKEEISIKCISDTLKYLSQYYEKDDFKERLFELPFVQKEKDEFSWASE